MPFTRRLCDSGGARPIRACASEIERCRAFPPTNRDPRRSPVGFGRRPVRRLGTSSVRNTAASPILYPPSACVGTPAESGDFLWGRALNFWRSVPPEGPEASSAATQPVTGSGFSWCGFGFKPNAAVRVVAAIRFVVGFVDRLTGAGWGCWRRARRRNGPDRTQVVV
jgi:hypothetical protein